MECLICFSDLDDSNIVNYKTTQNSKWYKSNFCIECIETLKKTQFNRYCDSVINTKCLKEQRALLLRGPPINIRDKHGFPECGEEEVYMLCKQIDNTLIDPKLEGSLKNHYWGTM
ncbi:hypothetical protein RS030_203178 [Cryptosporidium xiaoi]|uniref:Uncharacterized protein n=1 Tax=Cryptosporidium xiaoi TaxID=659607 RepID=A0AAV9XXQ0_9CRYT